MCTIIQQWDNVMSLWFFIKYVRYLEIRKNMNWLCICEVANIDLTMEGRILLSSIGYIRFNYMLSHLLKSAWTADEVINRMYM